MNAKHIPARMLSASLIALGLAVGPMAVAAQIPHLPPEKTQGPVAFRSGGVGLDESMAMREAAPKYALELEFVAKDSAGHGEYLAGNPVVITDEAGKTVLRTESEGPFLLASLPPGRYSVAATDDGRTKEQTVTVAPDKHQRIVFEW